jgi:hypothetical protein
MGSAARMGRIVDGAAAQRGLTKLLEPAANARRGPRYGRFLNTPVSIAYADQADS